MIRLAVLLPLALAACGLPEPPPRPGDVATPARLVDFERADTRPATADDSVQGRWMITAVDGKPLTGPWLELGGEGAGGVVRRTDGGVNMEGPQSPTSAALGCNHIRLSGWTRNGDKLFVGTGWSTITEKGCDASTMAIEERIHSVLRLPMTMELTAPDRLRLVNEAGTLDLVRPRS